MGRRGQAVIDEQGGIVAADAGFAAIMRLPAATLVDRNVFDFTAPADHESARQILARVGAGEPSTGSVRRVIAQDGSHLWVRGQVARIETRPRHFRLTIETTDGPADGHTDGHTDWAPPGDLLRVAHTLIDLRRGNRAAFGPLMIADHGWDILLAAYIREAEGAVLDTDALEAMVGSSATSIGRWVKALESEALVEVERGKGGDRMLIHLSPAAHRRIESLLSAATRRLYPAD